MARSTRAKGRRFLLDFGADVVDIDIQFQNGEDTMHRRPLAQGQHSAVELCTCGTVHVTIGPLTFRIPPEVYDSLCDTLVQGLVALKLEGQPVKTRAAAATA
jgi:hypothetical protein